MSEHENKIVILDTDVVATMVPSGARVVLQEGTEVTITQARGDSFTVNVFGNLARIEGNDAKALGIDVKSPLEDLPDDASIEDKVSKMLETVYDPEIPVNIVDLGLIYDRLYKKNADDKFQIDIVMTLTAPGCGMGPVIAQDVKNKIESIPEVVECEVELTFDPPWNHEMMSEAARLHLGMF